MHVLVIDAPHLVAAFANPRSDSARLVALCAYGTVTLEATGAGRHGDPAVYVERRDRIRGIVPPGTPDDLLHATSLEVLDDVATVARDVQRRRRNVHPHFVRKQIAHHAWNVLTDLGEAPAYDEPPPGREHVVRTAIVAGAGRIVSEDRQLLPPQTAGYRLGGRDLLVRSLADYVTDELAGRFDFRALDPVEVLRRAAGA
ncbi:MAG TPA: hypothetical protein VHF89_04840 [Solirubrobacteraceae bacterium]|nr:hypothetical protein [Solirubrobacteraceae bacterium]